MRQANDGRTAKANPSAFSIYLRTGRRSSPSPVEFKFNPYHDPQDGRFTFASGGGTGGHVGREVPKTRPVRPSSPKDQGASVARRGERWGGGGFTGGGGGSGGGAGATGDGYWLNPEEVADFKRKHPTMEPVVVKPGDTVDSVAQAHHMTAVRLAAANHLAVNAKLKPGDVLALPSPKALARKTDPATDPTTSVTGLAATRDPYRHHVQNGYDFSIDDEHRTRRAQGELADGAGTRSRRNQAEAGGKDRMPSDDGGHYIAARFNGPSEAFNHFAQDANFNRGAYRALEGRWAGAQGQGHRVYVDIVPHYRGSSKRPYAIEVTWYDDGKRSFERFSNSKKGR